MRNKAVILMADDSEEDCILATRAAAECWPQATFTTVGSGEDALDYLYRRGSFTDPVAAPVPSIILLDLKMPGKSGWDVLTEIKSTPRLRSIPVLALTWVNDEASIGRGYDAGVNAYITKPLDHARLCDALSAIGQFWLTTVQLPFEDRSYRKRW